MCPHIGLGLWNPHFLSPPIYSNVQPELRTMRLESENVSRSVVSNSLKPNGSARLLCPGDAPDKNTLQAVGSYFLLKGIFPNQKWNLSLLHCRQMLYQLSHQGSPRTMRLECFKKAASLCGLQGTILPINRILKTVRPC